MHFLQEIYLWKVVPVINDMPVILFMYVMQVMQWIKCMHVMQGMQDKKCIQKK